MERDFNLQTEFHRSQKAVDIALCDSFDTQTALSELESLVSAANEYLRGQGIKLPLILQVSRYLFKILLAFGVCEASDFPSTGT